MTGRRSHGRLSALNGVVHQGSVTNVDCDAMQVWFERYAARVVPKGLRVLPSGAMEGIRGIGRHTG